MRNWPNSPPSTISLILRMYGSKLCFTFTSNCTPWRSAASIMISASARVRVIGFSTRMCLPPLQGEQGMCSMKLVWGRNIDRIHIGTSTQRLCTLVRLPVKLAMEFLQLAWVDIGGGGEFDVRVLHKSRDHVAGAPSQPNDPHV